MGFQREADARRFWDDMRKRFEEFSLSFNPDKTRRIEFGRFAADRRAQRGLGKPAVGLPEKKGGVRHILGENPFVPQTAGYARGQGITRPGLASLHQDIGLAPLYQRLPPPSICAPTRAIAC